MDEIEIIKELREKVEKYKSETDVRLSALETRAAESDTRYAVINTKLSAILWGLGVIGTAVISVLVKMIFS